MSAAYGMVKFKSTGNIYMCCYEGTSDFMIPWLFKPEDCLYLGCYNAISYGRQLADEHESISLDISTIDDIDDIEIYSDYGSGFYWDGKGSESAKCITSEIDFGNCVYDYTDGKPKWVTDFWDGIK